MKNTLILLYAACSLCYIITSQIVSPFIVHMIGYIRKSFGGEKVLIENMFGMGEDFYLRA